MPEQTSAGETGGREAMSDERLAEIQRHHASYSTHPWVGIPACCSAHASADDVPDLLAEVERLRGHLAAIAVAQREGVAARRQLDAIRDQEEAELRQRAEAAERALGEMRERMADHLRRRAHDAAVADVNGYSCTEATTLMTAAQYVETGEWKAADGG